MAKDKPKFTADGDPLPTDTGPVPAEGGERSPPKTGKRDDKPKSLLEQETAMMRRIARLMETLPAASRERVAGYVYDHFSPKFVPTGPTSGPQG